MQSRKLRELLGNPGYTITNHKKYIAVGSQLCHDLISVDKETLKIITDKIMNEIKALLDSNKIEEANYIST